MNLCNISEHIFNYSQLPYYDDVKMEEYWNKFTKTLTENVSDTLDFFKYKCTVEEFFWLSSIFDDLIKETKDPSLILVLKEKLSTITEEVFNSQNFKTDLLQEMDYPTFVKDIESDIYYAEAYIEEEYLE